MNFMYGKMPETYNESMVEKGNLVTWAELDGCRDANSYVVEEVKCLHCISSVQSFCFRCTKVDAMPDPGWNYCFPFCNLSKN